VKKQGHELIIHIHSSKESAEEKLNGTIKFVLETLETRKNEANSCGKGVKNEQKEAYRERRRVVRGGVKNEEDSRDKGVQNEQKETCRERR
jgi:hypothetical protein